MPEPEGIIADAESRSYWNLQAILQAISARAVGDTKRERHALDMLILMGDGDE